MGLIIAGERSGVGKTTVTLALLAALTQQSEKVQSFKVGPDYIDPMFHRAITGRPCYNLDPVLTSETYVRQSYDQHHQTADHAIVEGVMGLFDGASAIDHTASTAHIARLLKLPVLLVVDCARLSRSVAALVQGYRCFDPDIEMAGVVLNQVGSDRHLAILTAALNMVQIPILGVLRRDTAIQLPDRHLGLVPTGELPAFQAIAQRLAHLGQQCFDWQQLRPWLRKSEGSGTDSVGSEAPLAAETPPGERVRIAIATDPAFNFYYPDNLSLLTAQGTELIPWSPLADSLPGDIDGLYLGGGFPEMFAEGLAANKAARTAVKQAIVAGMPTYAECGGLMYLCETLIDFGQKAWPMVGILPTSVSMTGQLNLGYRRLTATHTSPLLASGETIRGHEFHRSQLATPLSPAAYQSEPAFQPSPAQAEGFCQENLLASYVHLHWGARPDIPDRFVQRCREYRTLNRGSSS